MKVEGNVLHVTRPTDQPPSPLDARSVPCVDPQHGCGGSKGYEIKQELVGVGFKAEAKGQILELSLGYSHDIYVMLPARSQGGSRYREERQPDRDAEKSADKQLIGQVAAKIRSLRKPEPYKGKGIKFVGEQLRRKAGKSANAK